MKKILVALCLSSVSFFSFADGVVMLPPNPSINPSMNPALMGGMPTIPSNSNSVSNLQQNSLPTFSPPIYNEETGDNSDEPVVIDDTPRNYIYSSKDKKNLTCQDEVFALSKNLNILSSKEETLKSLVTSKYWSSLTSTEKTQNIKILAEIYKLPGGKVEEAKKKIISKYALECKNELMNSNNKNQAQ